MNGSPCAVAESEQEQALAIGACRILEGRGLWRHISRDWEASRALMLALIASGGRLLSVPSVHDACGAALPGTSDSRSPSSPGTPAPDPSLRTFWLTLGLAPRLMHCMNALVSPIDGCP